MWSASYSDSLLSFPVVQTGKWEVANGSGWLVSVQWHVQHK